MSLRMGVSVWSKNRGIFPLSDDSGLLETSTDRENQKRTHEQLPVAMENILKKVLMCYTSEKVQPDLLSEECTYYQYS